MQRGIVEQGITTDSHRLLIDLAKGLRRRDENQARGVALSQFQGGDGGVDVHIDNRIGTLVKPAGAIYRREMKDEVDIA